MNSDQNPYNSSETSDLRSSSSGKKSGGEFQSYLIHNAIVAGMCCVPMGLWGIITARKAETLHKAGNPEAETVAAKAKNIFIAGLSLGSILIILVIAAQIAVEANK